MDKGTEIQEELMVYVNVEGEASHPGDQGVHGNYAVKVTLKKGVKASGCSGKELAEIAKAVKVQFNEDMMIETLDDFEITLTLEDGTVIDDEGFEEATGLVWVTNFEGQVESQDDEGPDVHAMVNDLDEKTAKAVLACLLADLVYLGFHKDDPINGADCVDAISGSYNSAMARITVASMSKSLVESKA